MSNSKAFADLQIFELAIAAANHTLQNCLELIIFRTDELCTPLK